MEQKHSDAILPNVREPEMTQWNALKKESTISLLRRIVQDSDALALKVFHETRTLFYRNGKWVRLTEFVRALKDSSLRGAGEDIPTHIDMSEASDNAYDLTLAKFYNIPSQNLKPLKTDKSASDNNGFTWNVDCRLYFKQLLKDIDKDLSKKPIISEVDIEEKVASIATRFVIRHFHLSMKESKRRDTISKRYAWKVGGRIIYLFYPSYLTAKQFRKWLEDNVTDINPDAPDEKNRIQKIIDQKYPCGANIRVDDPKTFEDPEIEDDPDNENEVGRQFSNRPNPDVPTTDKSWIEDKEGNQFCDSLRLYVAREKSEHLDDLRPAIGSLGKEVVYKLVNRIFTDMAGEGYNLSEVAHSFNLSKATLSRFAGSDWLRGKEKDSDKDIPDLWINTARVLAENTNLMETVKNTKYYGIIDDILTIVSPKEGQENERQ
jgi:hypothetical protein